MSKLEDQHIQLEVCDADGIEVKQLLNYDIVLRVNEDGTGYAGFELVHYPTEEILHSEDFKEA